MNEETHPEKMIEMEAYSRQLIGSLNPNNNNNIFYTLLMISAGIIVSGGIITAPFSPDFIKDIWVLPILGFLLYLIIRYLPFTLPIISFDGSGINFKPFVFSDSQFFDWTEIDTIHFINLWREFGEMGLHLKTKNGTLIKCMSDNQFYYNLHDAFKIFQSRYSLEE